MQRKITSILHLALVAASLAAPTTNANAQGPITRKQIIANAVPYTSFSWTATSANLQSGISCGQRTIYFANWVQVGTNISMPYAWGGNSSIDRFNQLIAAGISAGDICSPTGGGCAAAGPSGAGEGCVAGVDCSGFISNVWNLPNKLGTSDLQTFTQGYASLSSLQPGDILNKPGSHVRLFYFFESPSGLYVVMEASGNGWNTGVHRYTPNDLTGYYPRYNPNAQ